MQPVKASTMSLLIALFLAGCGGNTGTAPQNGAPQAAAAVAPNEVAALDAISRINDAQANYFRRNRRYGLNFDELVESHLLKADPSAEQTGYDFKLRPAADAQTYKLSVTPAGSSATARYFFTDESGAVHADTGRDATADSPKL
jgi:hypothetical protein